MNAVNKSDAVQAQSKFVTITEAAKMLGVGYKVVYNRVKSGELPATVVERAYRIPREVVEKYLSEQNTDAGCLSVDEAAAMLNVSYTTVFNRIQSGVLPATMVERAYRIPREAVEKYLSEQNMYVTVTEAAKILNVHRNTVISRIKSGELPATLVDDIYRIPRDAVDTFRPKPIGGSTPVIRPHGYISIEETAEILGIHRNTVHRYVQTSKIPAEMVKRAYHIPRDAVEAYLAKQKACNGCLSVDEAAETLGITRKTVLRWIKSGKLPTTMVKHAHRIPRDAVEAYLATHSAK